jgi:hypothetical protein
MRQTMDNIREPEKQHKTNQSCQLADCSAALLKIGRIKSRAAGRIYGQISAIFVQKGRKGLNFLKVCMFSSSFPLKILGK